MSLLEQVLAGTRGSAEPLHRHACLHVAIEMTGDTRVAVGGNMFVVHAGESDEPTPLYESGVAYVENTNPLLAVARSYEVPSGYGDYQVSSGERADESGDPDSFSLTILNQE